MYYFRDSAENELDLIIDKEEYPYAVEIKAGVKYTDSMLRSLKYWQKYQPNSLCILIHGGKKDIIIDERMSVLPWTALKDF